MATCNALDIFAGEDVVLNLFMVCATTTAFVPDVTGWNTCFHLKLNATDTPALVNKSGVITAATCGQFTVTINSSDTVALPPTAYSYDIWRVDPGSFAVLSIGTFNIHWSVLYP